MENTIAAIGTPTGEGGIGIVRISGENSKSVLSKIFVFGGSDDFIPRRLNYGKIVDPQSHKVIDEVLAVYMRGPHTYTGEDVVEIQCHGGTVPLRKILQLVLKNGASLAQPGEFTKRAFLNGKMDLSQAEAVIDLIKAKTETGYEVAVNQLSGGLSLEVEGIRKSLLDLLVEVTVNLDYPDEDIEEITYENLINHVSSIGDRIETLIDSASTGKILREGLALTIIGKPNVGKSSLLNALLKEKRAIVTDIPGTTRDTIEEQVQIKGIPIRITDTAGIRDTQDEIEKIGIEKTKAALNEADLLLLPLDASKELGEEDLEIIKAVGDRPVVVLLNKQDLGSVIREEDLRSMISQAAFIETSLIMGQGLKELEDIIENLVFSGNVRESESLIITNVRHENLLRGALEALTEARFMAESKEALDFIEVDLKNAYSLLGEITGETISEEILDQVFARFCLGK